MLANKAGFVRCGGVKRPHRLVNERHITYPGTWYPHNAGVTPRRVTFAEFLGVVSFAGWVTP